MTKRRRCALFRSASISCRRPCSRLGVFYPSPSYIVSSIAPITIHHVLHCSSCKTLTKFRGLVAINIAIRVPHFQEMPATRSSSRAFRHPSSHSKSSSSHTPVEPHPTSSSSIVLNLAAPSPMPLPLRQQSSTTKKTKAKTPIPIPHEVIEISSDEDDIPRPPRPLGPSGSSTSDLRKEIRRLRDVCSPVRLF